MPNRAQLLGVSEALDPLDLRARNCNSDYSSDASLEHKMLSGAAVWLCLGAADCSFEAHVIVMVCTVATVLPLRMQMQVRPASNFFWSCLKRSSIGYLQQRMACGHAELMSQSTRVFDTWI